MTREPDHTAAPYIQRLTRRELERIVEEFTEDGEPVYRTVEDWQDAVERGEVSEAVAREAIAVMLGGGS